MTAISQPMVLFIVGATASGKTAAAISLAQALGRQGREAEIVNADSRQIYRDMSIGTAKPSPEQLQSIPHHLIDVVEPREGFTLATFLSAARGAVSDITSRSAVPIVVGGTGQYVWGLAEGWEVPPVAPQPDIRARLEARASQHGGEALFEQLRKTDPDAASFIDPRNTRRVIRALEVIEASGMSFSQQRRRTPLPFAPSLFGLSISRAELYDRIDKRVDTMIAVGFVDEVRHLLAAGCGPSIPAFSSVGYREIASYLAGELTLDEAKERIRTATHRLARSQANWFRGNDSRIAWQPTVAGLVDEALTSMAA